MQCFNTQESSQTPDLASPPSSLQFLFSFVEKHHHSINRKILFNRSWCSSYNLRKEDSLVFAISVLTYIAADVWNVKSGLIPKAFNWILDGALYYFHHHSVLVPPISPLSNINICQRWFALPLILSPLKYCKYWVNILISIYTHTNV